MQLNKKRQSWCSLLFLWPLGRQLQPFVFFLNIFQLALHVSALRPWSHAVAYWAESKRCNTEFHSHCKSESEIRDKQMFMKIFGKKLSPSGATRFSPRVPLLHRPCGPSLPSSRTPPLPLTPESVDQGWLGWPQIAWAIVAAELPHGASSASGAPGQDQGHLLPGDKTADSTKSYSAFLVKL